jgi:hypothetical protein
MYKTTPEELETAARGLRLLKARRTDKEYDARDTFILDWLECILEERLEPVEVTVEIPVTDESFYRKDIVQIIVDHVQARKPRPEKYELPPPEKKKWEIGNVIENVLGVIGLVAVAALAIGACIADLRCIPIVLAFIGFFVVLDLYNRRSTLKEEKLKVKWPPLKLKFTNILEINDVLESPPVWSDNLVISSWWDRYISDICHEEWDSSRIVTTLDDRQFPRLEIAERDPDIFNLIRFYQRDGSLTTFKEVWEETERRFLLYSCLWSFEPFDPWR